MSLNGVWPSAGGFRSEGYTDRLLNSDEHLNGHVALELANLLDAVQQLVMPFVARANTPPGASSPAKSGTNEQMYLVERHEPQELVKLLNLQLGSEGKGKAGVLSTLGCILRYSVNTWDQGFIHKLSASTNPIGVISEYVLAVLNANVHVYEVSPVLTTVERTTSHALATLFDLKGPYAGGVSQPGGSAANLTALIVARSTLFPSTKLQGYDGRNFVVLASENAHYSLEKAAQICGFGSSNIWSVPVDAQGSMRVDELEKLIRKAKGAALNPFFVCATAGTTVLGVYDPLPAIAEVCKREALWFHVDASWGGAVVFSANQRHKMAGSKCADSLTFNPHKMLGVPLTCSFLLTSDLRKFKEANSIPAGYLFHGAGSSASDASEMADSEQNRHEGQCQKSTANGFDETATSSSIASPPSQKEEREHDPTAQRTSADINASFSAQFSESLNDLGDLTLQCGRKGDSLKLLFSWLYYGTSYYGERIDEAFSTATYMASLVDAHPRLTLISENPPPCLQVCFYYIGDRKEEEGKEAGKPEYNTRVTMAVVKGLVDRGFMVDYAPGKGGMFLRAVVHLSVKKETVERLVKDVVEVGDTITTEHLTRQEGKSEVCSK